MKKIFAIVLAVCLAFGCISSFASYDVRDFSTDTDKLSFDELYADEVRIAFGSGETENAKKSVTASETIRFYGWFGTTEGKVAKYGYTADEGATFVLDSDPITGYAGEAEVIAAGGDSRFSILVNVAGITEKTTYRVVAQLESGKIIYLNRLEPNKDRDIYATVEANTDAPAPQTGDMTVAVFAVIAVVALAAVVVFKKRVNA